MLRGFTPWRTNDRWGPCNFPLLVPLLLLLGQLLSEISLGHDVVFQRTEPSIALSNGHFSDLPQGFGVVGKSPQERPRSHSQ
jgi:hypothetical protein